MKNLFIVASAIILFTSYQCIAQQSVTFRYVNASELYLNEDLITEQLTIADIKAKLGEPDKKVTNKGEDSYVYAKTGIVFFTIGDTLKGVCINFNWDGDTNYPQQSFTGKLLIGKTEISKDTKQDAITALKAIEFNCIPILCFSKDKTAKTNSMIGFKDGLITQVAILLGVEPEE